VIPIFNDSEARKARSTHELRDSKIDLMVYYNEAGRAQGDIYIDDYSTFEYKNGNYTLVTVIFEKNQNGTEKNLFLVQHDGLNKVTAGKALRDQCFIG